MIQKLPSTRSNFARFSLALCFAFFLSGNLAAQNVANYGFSQSTAQAYTELDNPTVLAVSTSLTGTGKIDDQVYNLPAGTIPFTFTYAGNAYTGLNVCANGFVNFGTSTSDTYTPISSSIAYAGVIAASANDLHALYDINGLTGDLSYQVVGTAPNREFVIQWKHFRPYSASTSTTAFFDWNFQIRLREDNTIGMAYDYKVTGIPTSSNVQVGLRGATNSDFNTRLSMGTTASNWTSTTAGTTTSVGVTTNSTALPQNGLTFNWTPPAACIAPAAQPTNLVLTNTGIIINASFTAATPAADRYLVLRTIAGTTPNLPVNGTTYAVGNSTALNAYVAYYGTGTSFENNYNNGIRGNNNYVYTIYSVSSACTGGPLYLTENPLSGNITNCLQSVSGLAASAQATNSFVLNWTATENGTAETYNTIVEVATDNNFTNMVAGSPFTVNPTTTTLTVNGLQANTQYFFRAKNAYPTGTTCESAYSSTANTFTTCLPTTAFYETFDGIASGSNLPNCWTKLISPSGPTINVSSTDPSSTPNNVSFYDSGYNLANYKLIAVSPQLTNLAAGTHRLKLKARKTSATASTSLDIVALDGNTASANATIIASITNLTTTFQEFTISFENYSGNGSYIGIQRLGGSYTYAYIDDVIWEPIPSCPELTYVAAESPTFEGATITWGNPLQTVPAEGYEYIVTTTNAIPSENNTFTPIPAGTNIETLTGLASNQTYYFWMRRLCSTDDKSPWATTSFTTAAVTPAPWTEGFATTAVPAGWTTAGWTLGNTSGAPGNPNTNIYKNMWDYSTASTGTFSTINVGPLDTDTYELSFDYRQGAYSSPYAPLATWGNFEVQVSTDFGTTWTTVGTITNETGDGSYIKKTFPLSAYENQYVKVRINSTWAAGDYYLAFDNFKIEIPEDLGTIDHGKNVVSLYPNPTNGIVSIETSQPIESVKVFNAIGQIVADQKSATIDLSGQPSGIYVVTVTFDDNSSIVKKVIKK